MAEPGLFTISDRGFTLRVRVQPGASRSAIEGIVEGHLRVRLSAKPVQGAANTALVELLARVAGVAKSRVTIVTGHSARGKLVRIETPEPQAAMERLLGSCDRTVQRKQH